eukprot:RCo037780
MAFVPFPSSRIKKLGPFAIHPAVRLHIRINSQYDFTVLGPEGVVTNLCKTLGVKELKGFISSLSRTTLDAATRAEAAIPWEAQYFCFAYPLKGVAKVPEDKLPVLDPQYSFLVFGGFMYFNEKRHLLQLNALGKGDALKFEGPYKLPPSPFINRLKEENRFQPVTVAPLVQAGAKYFIWIPPVDGHRLLDKPDPISGFHGAFVYLFDSQSADQNCFFKIVDERRSLLGYVTDCEGSLEHFRGYVQRSHVLSFAKESTELNIKLELAPDCCFIFGGDGGDRGFGTLRLYEALVDLKKRYPDRVVLLVGNRDANKIRLTSELEQKEMDRVMTTEGPYWVPEDKRVTPKAYLTKLLMTELNFTEAQVTDPMIVRANTKTNRLRYMLKETFGADGDFERRRRELAERRGVVDSKISDSDVVESYEQSVAADGVIREYLRLGQLAHIQENTLFVHGGVIRPDKGGIVQCLGVVPGREGRMQNLSQWVVQLNKWYLDQVQEWIDKPHWDDDRKRGGMGLINYVVLTPECTVVLGRHLKPDGMPLDMPPEVLQTLKDNQIFRMVLGHTPHGNCPTIIRNQIGEDHVHVIMADTGYSDMKAMDSRGKAVSAVTLCGKGTFVEGLLEDGRPFGYRISLDPKDATADPYIGLVGKQLVEGRSFFVKAKLGCVPHNRANTSEWISKPENYLLCNVSGFNVTYKDFEADEIGLLFGQSPEAAAQAVEHLNFAPTYRADYYDDPYGYFSTLHPTGSWGR